ncbi:hypothetical protein AMS68_001417 [Peltaster fructicola]|uniref:F-box domain-containing protein n=1 Tax=Peltaster fructicola TaxID=286661 RepID=A0A6H0XN31_9PEZI|nr:hypothetical protein AMS68_001417 [Peltaster fructicola]
MHINDLPTELLDDILLKATALNEQNGERYTYGLSQALLPLEQTRISKYVRGPLSFESLRWDSTSSIRQVCSKWHEWAVAFNIEQVFERRWRGSERWADLTLRRPSYKLYEMIENPRGLAVYRDPYSNLKQTCSLLKALPETACHVRRLWFNGFYVAQTDRLILDIIAQCPQLELLSVPWTVLRRSTAEDWASLLKNGIDGAKPLYSLEIQSICLPKDQAAALQNETTTSPLLDSRVDFSALKRLKFFGNTIHKPVVDRDLLEIARTATGLTCLDFTNISTVSVAGMLAIVKASRSTLEVLEHSPRSSDGFYHPFPGTLDSGEHICELLTSLPKMRDLSISIPYMCAKLFSNHALNWEGELQVRATDICGCNATSTATTRGEKLEKVLVEARELIAARKRLGHQLSIELFFAGCIFEPDKKFVHGDFSLPTISSGGIWPSYSHNSTKGPYGSSGTYGKGDLSWDAVLEQDFLHGASAGHVSL